MHLQIYQVAAFTDAQFGGDPAAVVPLEQWLDDPAMQKYREIHARAGKLVLEDVARMLQAIKDPETPGGFDRSSELDRLFLEMKQIEQRWRPSWIPPR